MPDPSGPPSGVPTTERVRSVFSTIAPGYDRVNRVVSLGIDRSWRKELVSACALGPDDRVLDLCAGTGDVSLALAQQGRPAEVVVTDFVAEMLEIAEQKAAAYDGPTRLCVQQADAQDLPFADESFDTATVAFGVRNLPERARNFAEVHRVLKPGGRYVILEFSRPPSSAFRVVYHAYLRSIVPLVGGLMTGNRQSYVYLNDSIRQFPTQSELAGELCSAGFAEVGWQDLSGGIVALHVARKAPQRP